MSKHHLRHDKNCLNCGNHVKDRFCSHCGQENTEPRQTFGHLVKHFIEDITHYDGAFWKTIKNLLFKPSFLTKEYLAGKRNSYLPPVRLYIFVSFITFFIPYLLPDNFGEFDIPLEKELATTDTTVKYGIGSNSEHTFYAKSRFTYFSQYDSAQKKLPEAKRDGWFGRWLSKKEIELGKIDADVLEEKFNTSFWHNFPKALFAYMPLFALIISLLHRKKKWMYFDHAIFTLHFFSFILIVFTVLNIINSLVPNPYFFSKELYGQIFVFFSTMPVLLWFVIYFYKAHRKFYEEKWFLSFVKSSFIFFINLSLFFLLIFGLSVITVMNLH